MILWIITSFHTVEAQGPEARSKCKAGKKLSGYNSRFHCWHADSCLNTKEKTACGPAPMGRISCLFSSVHCDDADALGRDNQKGDSVSSSSLLSLKIPWFAWYQYSWGEGRTGGSTGDSKVQGWPHLHVVQHKITLQEVRVNISDLTLSYSEFWVFVKIMQSFCFKATSWSKSKLFW